MLKFLVIVVVSVALATGRPQGMEDESEFPTEPIVGGQESIPVDDPTLVKYIKYALSYLMGDRPKVALVLKSVVSATRQVVAGLLYRSNFLLDDGCDNKTSCYIEIWDRAGFRPSTLDYSVACTNSSTRIFTIVLKNDH